MKVKNQNQRFPLDLPLPQPLVVLVLEAAQVHQPLDPSQRIAELLLLLPDLASDRLQHPLQVRRPSSLDRDQITPHQQRQHLAEIPILPNQRLVHQLKMIQIPCLGPNLLPPLEVLPLLEAQRLHSEALLKLPVVPLEVRQLQRHHPSRLEAHHLLHQHLPLDLLYQHQPLDLLRQPRPLGLIQRQLPLEVLRPLLLLALQLQVVLEPHQRLLTAALELPLLPLGQRRPQLRLEAIRRQRNLVVGLVALLVAVDLEAPQLLQLTAGSDLGHLLPLLRLLEVHLVVDLDPLQPNRLEAAKPHLELEALEHHHQHLVVVAAALEPQQHLQWEWMLEAVEDSALERVVLLLTPGHQQADGVLFEPSVRGGLKLLLLLSFNITSSLYSLLLASLCMSKLVFKNHSPQPQYAFDFCSSLLIAKNSSSWT